MDNDSPVEKRNLNLKAERKKWRQKFSNKDLGTSN